MILHFLKIDVNFGFLLILYVSFVLDELTSTVRTFIKQSTKLWSEIKLELKSVKTRMSNVEKCLEFNNNKVEERELLNGFLPLSKKVNVLEFNEKLKEKNFALEFVSIYYIKRINVIY